MSHEQTSPEQRIARRKADLLFENVLISQAFSVVNATIVAWLRYQEQPVEMSVWWGLVMLAAAARLGLTALYRTRRDLFGDRRWILVKGLFVLASGLIWGIGGAVILRTGEPWAVMVTAFTIAGMTAAAVPLLSAELRIYYAYSAAMLAPSLIGLATLPFTRWIGTVIIMTVLFWITLMSSARRFSNALMREIEREAELTQARDRAEEASRAKSAFLANMSHELRTPMNGLLGINEVLSLMELDEKQAELVEVMGRAGRSMMAVLSQILTFSQLESGQYEIARQRCSPSLLAQNVVQMHEAAARLKGLALRLDIAPDLPAELLSAPQDLSNVMTILVGNAVKFTERGTIDIALWQGNESSQPMLYASVSDTGPGIPAELQEKIFDAFTLGDDSITRSKGGLGLGLATAQRIARVMGGSVSLESMPGAGSRFFLALPYEPL